ncbi:diguanylate cyclase [Mesorhizobium sp. M4B.F.Ca.ET.215.01.1.1]|uniref:Diguanylate cyclase n=8 Tax=Mesorhizobium TaxID=68287 RepID=A0ABU5ATK2_9HYPH|nr:MULTISPECIES: diguanylate cyclase [Mesorhizobium]RVD37128.1 diguanylate cyclase [Mesorhizobium sp. M4B.F.Ca.ET.019.03.1.1]TGT48336.1 diguanylate cyclase [Mesorhizobium sp. M4B.F.Ca.ET.169.01.1.1]MDX8540546.1 diguanylate cyclase [Mesorhizobium abyssinicae]RUW22560.1 diguanylate cyclase [Mesorhizobium sp. M4B.F.Ca.ET.013.02.1.1]RWA60937.1 MAG: diguanylate cyclase [Mesorhizobium sp.]
MAMASRGAVGALEASVPARLGTAGLAEAIGRMAQLVEHSRERIRLLEAVIENFPGGVSLFDQDLNMVICNQRQRTLLDYPDDLFANGYPSMEMLFRFNAERGEYGPGEVELHVARRLALVRQREAHVYERTRPNGTIVEVRGMPIDGGGFVTTYFDVTEQRRDQATIAHMAHHDALTDLPNRMLFSDRLHSAVALARRGALMAVHYLDLDKFKPVNDGFGHKAGDRLLIDVAARLRGAVRDHDTVARLGGDEFAIVQTGIAEKTDAAALASRIIDRFREPFTVAGTPFVLGLSVGIALAPGDGVTSDDLLQKADMALYRSKSGGRGTFHFFEA